MSELIYNSNRAQPPVGVTLVENAGKWYWVDDIEVPNGPFNTRQEAVQAAWADQDLDLDGENY